MSETAVLAGTNRAQGFPLIVKLNKDVIHFIVVRPGIKFHIRVQIKIPHNWSTHNPLLSGFSVFSRPLRQPKEKIMIYIYDQDSDPRIV